jgi:hypothetical protein
MAKVLASNVESSNVESFDLWKKALASCGGNRCPFDHLLTTRLPISSVEFSGAGAHGFRFLRY